MLGYDKQRRDNYFHFLEVKRWGKLKWIDDEALDKLITALSPRYEPTNLFVSIGLFILTCIIISAGVGFASLIFIEVIDSNSGWFLSLVGALILLFVLQKFVINEKHQFGSGADEATLYSCLGFFHLTFILLFENLFDSALFISIFYFILLGVPAFIYKDRLLTAGAHLALFAVVFFLAYNIGGIMTLLIPFLLMGLSFFGFTFSEKRIVSSTDQATEQCWEVINWISIAMFYLSGNYLVVMELSKELGLADAFPFFVKILFMILTAAIPIAYIYFGLIIRNLALLNIGLIAVALSVMTVRYYHEVMPIEYALILGGAIILGIVWLALRFWKEDKLGVTAKADEDLDSGLKIESLVLDQTFGKIDSTNTFSGEGGKFGGGGASGNF
ncbi:hypothetical protein [Fulvivirga lutimaris]|uniref:hypothetical protein n=1 Tax=Fulvivirga lutimaris TaxID=1819566 RepID=UPI0012BBB04E|nr:hypothetical protein [Fulvivirga lutimaris]MTI39596.1 hypothetical protein [Fulvivirga lutimaris]